jgi:hypothetical protein
MLPAHLIFILGTATRRPSLVVQNFLATSAQLITFQIALR